MASVTAPPGGLTFQRQQNSGLTSVNLSDEKLLTNGYNNSVLGLLQGSYGTPRSIRGTIGITYK